MPHIDFEVDLLTGKVTAEGQQFSGGACKMAIKKYTDKLGNIESHKAKFEQAVITRKVEQKL